jgi:hypothetical protein
VRDKCYTDNDIQILVQTAQANAEEDLKEELELQREELLENYISIADLQRGSTLIFLPCLPGIYTCLTI